MNGFGRQPAKEEMNAMLKANAITLGVYFGAIRAAPLVRSPHVTRCTHNFGEGLRNPRWARDLPVYFKICEE
jgi:hypothetical protein